VKTIRVPSQSDAAAPLAASTTVRTVTAPVGPSSSRYSAPSSWFAKIVRWVTGAAAGAADAGPAITAVASSAADAASQLVVVSSLIKCGLLCLTAQ
jgi:hypothetical protein